MKLKFVTDNPMRVVDEDSGIELRLYSSPDVACDAFGLYDPKAPSDVYRPGKDYLLLTFYQISGTVSVVKESGRTEKVRRVIGYRATPSMFWTSVGDPYRTRCIKDPAAFQEFVFKMLIFYLRHEGISEPIVEFVNIIPR